MTRSMTGRGALVRPAFAAGVLVWMVAGAGQVAAQPLVSPADRAVYEGSSSTSYPLGRHNARVQQLHADLGVAPLSLQGHAYRRDAVSTRGLVSGFQVEMSVTLSMSPLTPSTASRTFSDNAGAPVAVLPRTTVSFPATSRPAQAPAAQFVHRIPYATPFAYPAGGGTLCVDTVLFGNFGPNGNNANFTAYADAHELSQSGRVEQPGYPYGQGCAPPPGGSAASATFDLIRTTQGLDLDIQARNGMATDATANAFSALLFGYQQASSPWALRPTCTMLTSLDAFGGLPGPNTTTGSWSGTLQNVGPLATGFSFHLQVASGHPLNGVALSDASHLVVPPLGPTPVPAARVAHGSDRGSLTGTVSLVVPVTEFY